jgi:hypothetical protein
MGAEKPDEYPHMRRKMQRKEREAQLEYVQDWLDGKVQDPALDHDPNPKPIEMEVGEKRDPYEPRPLREGPGLTIIAPEDDGAVEQHNGWSVLRPGKRSASLREYQRRP